MSNFMSGVMGDYVNIVEVGPRDGLQNEKNAISLTDKILLINQLSKAGLKHIEAGSFVSPRWVPQMADSAAVFAGIKRHDDVIYSALTPNLHGFNAALAANVDQVAIFAAASESFSQKNINCSIAQSIERFKPVIESAQKHKLKVRAYVSCILGCPYEGAIKPEQVIKVTEQLLALGCYEVSLGDTIGVGTPFKTKALLSAMLNEFKPHQLALHFHDTYGQALANQYVALELGIRTFDSSIAGLGGCPYATGASGNVATEDFVYMLEGSGLKTGIDLNRLITAGQTACKALSRVNNSKVSNAIGPISSFPVDSSHKDSFKGAL
jgi:hydroxymethylglutaryl-CoA lyase